MKLCHLLIHDHVINPLPICLRVYEKACNRTCCLLKDKVRNEDTEDGRSYFDINDATGQGRPQPSRHSARYQAWQCQWLNGVDGDDVQAIAFDRPRFDTSRPSR